MIKAFNKSEILDCDCYVADYTNQEHNKKGVEISLSPFDDIEYFHLKKKNKTQHSPYLAVNLEHYPALTKGVKNCECIFYSLTDRKKSWVLFLETKYCENPENIVSYQAQTVRQMSATLNRLEELGLMKRDEHRLYFAYSVPTQSEIEPFYPFAFELDFIYELKKQGINFYGYNTVLIATSTILQVPGKAIKA